jgi:hypothetical protein
MQCPCQSGIEQSGELMAAWTRYAITTGLAGAAHTWAPGLFVNQVAKFVPRTLGQE